MGTRLHYLSRTSSVYAGWATSPHYSTECKSILFEEAHWKHSYMQGCRGSLRLADGTIPNSPYDVVIARLEKRQFRDSSGMLKTPSKPSAVHYHFRLACVRACDAHFLPSSFVIPHDVAVLLSAQHQQYLRLEFPGYVNLYQQFYLISIINFSDHT